MTKNTYLFLLLLLISAVGYAQEEQSVEDIGTALRSGSSRELIKFCVDRIEIEINGEKSTYSKTQAEAVFKDFFSKNIARGFQYVHQGSSPSKGLKYAIGSYSVDGGSFRVYMLLKSNNNAFLIDTISFTKE